MRRVRLEPSMPDHMHWYRVIGAVYLRAEANAAYDSAQVPVADAVLISGEGCPPSPETDQQVYERWLNSRP